jgi:dUTP pyrophosphatase
MFPEKMKMDRIAEFEKVSFEQFREGWIGSFGEMPEELIRSAYQNTALPRRATSGSAGYDFFLPVDITLKPGETVKIPTGVRTRMSEGWVLMLFPRSGLGFKYRLQLNNTVGVIDSDYYGSDNEGHIFAKITNDSNEQKTLQLKAGEAFMQGVFLPFGITESDGTTNTRNGGFGSTSV